MTRAGRMLAGVIAALAATGIALAGDGSGEFPMPSGDAVARRTDSTNSGWLPPDQTLPDLINISIQRWAPTNPQLDPFAGSIPGGGSANFFRLQLTFAGLVNPPGTIGLGGQPFEPMKFGKSPLYGFVELDVDEDEETGGEAPTVAALRPLGQASRFGGRFRGSSGSMQALNACDLNQPWTQEPQVCLSGADFSLVLCGCHPITIVSMSNPISTTFEAGDTWVVEGRFFQRAGGYIPASLVQGGSALGAYDPLVRLQFSNDAYTGMTTVTLVYPLTQAGAGLLTGQSAQPINTYVNDQTSVAEAVTDLINSSTRPGLTGLTYELIHRWAGRSANNSLNPRRWNVRAIVGTTYPNPEDGLYVWTDVGPNLLRGDVNGDGVRSWLDRNAILAFIAAHDGQPGEDADQTVNGSVQLIDFGANFSIYDVNGDGFVDSNDLVGLPTCDADWNASGSVTVQDVFDFLSSWFAGDADFNHSNSTTVQDIFDFLTAWFAGC